jgi:hypothetical protein
MTKEELSTEFLDTLTLDGYCPGFNLWAVVATDGKKYLMASDHKSAIGTRLYFRTNGKLDMESAELIGPNPDAKTWKKAKGME